jgi:ArsR family transcriptional regulator
MSISCVDFCRGLSDETRQAILRLVMGREMSVGEIVEAFHASQPAISHHLNVLKGLGLVRSRKEGKQVFYTAVQENIEECCGMLMARFGQVAKLEE